MAVTKPMVTVELAELGLPPIEAADEPPVVPHAEHHRRIDAAVAATETDLLVVYGDHEHRGNLAYLCGFDPRYEEAILVLGAGVRRLVVGTEGAWYARSLGVDLEIVTVPALGCAGVDRPRGTLLAEALRDAGITLGVTVGIVGWKVFRAQDWGLTVPSIAAPAFLVDAIRALAGSPAAALDATAIMLDSGLGLRMQNDVHAIASYEWGASRASRATYAVVHAARPGMREDELISVMDYRGEPLQYDPVVASGDNIVSVVRSPTARKLAVGDPVVVMIGMWGGGACRGGMLAHGEQDLAPDVRGYLESVAIPYWRAMATWWELVRVGASAANVYARVQDACRDGGFEPEVGVGFALDVEDWIASPFAADSPHEIRSGMVLSADIWPSLNNRRQVVHMGDVLAVADEHLRAQLAEVYPETWTRIAARRRFMRERMGVQVADDLLPLSVGPCHLAPFWLEPNRALRFVP